MATKFIPAHKVVYNSFLGIDNVADDTKLAGSNGETFLTRAENVYFTATKSAKRRDGYYLFKGGSYSSLWGNGRVCYAVNGGNLVEVFDDSSEVVVMNNVGSKMVFVDTHDGFVYFTNGSLIGKIKNSVAYSLSETVEEFKTTLPPGDFLAYIAPRLIIVKGNVLYFSSPRNKDVYHRHQGFLQFDTNVIMVAPIGTNMFVSDERNMYFLRRINSPLDIPMPMFRVDVLTNYPAVPGGQFKYVDNVPMHNGSIPFAAVWLSKRGICVGGPGGEFENVTERRYRMPEVVTSAALEYRSMDDMNLFMATFKGN